MKPKILFILVIFSLSVFIVDAQVPDAFSYQAVVRNATGEIIADQNVSFRISILQGSDNGDPVYVETHSAQTNQFGLANLKIGKGTISQGIFDPGGWGIAPHFIKVEIDPVGGSSFMHMGTTQLLSVPYAFHAQTVEEDNIEDADADPVNEIQTISLSGTELILSDGGGTVSLPSSGGGDNWGSQTVETDATLDGNGTSSNPLSVVGDLTDDQNLSISGNDLSISDGNTISLPESTGSQWLADGSNIYYNSGKVGVGTAPVNATLHIKNNSSNDVPHLLLEEDENDFARLTFKNSTYPSKYWLWSGKPHLSDISSEMSLSYNNGSSRNDILFISGKGKVGIGKRNSSNYKLLIYDDEINGAGIWSENGTAYMDINRGSLTSDGVIVFLTGGSKKFYTGLVYGTNSYRISPDLTSFNGLEVQEDNNVRVSDDFIAGGEIQTEKSGDANMVAFAYGRISDNGAKNGCTSNVGTVEKESTGVYRVEIDDLGSGYTSMVTPNHGSAYLTGVVTVRQSSFFRVAIWDTKNDTYKDGGFSFVVYKP